MDDLSGSADDRGSHAESSYVGFHASVDGGTKRGEEGVDAVVGESSHRENVESVGGTADALPEFHALVARAAYEHHATAGKRGGGAGNELRLAVLVAIADACVVVVKDGVAERRVDDVGPHRVGHT